MLVFPIIACYVFLPIFILYISPAGRTVHSFAVLAFLWLLLIISFSIDSLISSRFDGFYDPNLGEVAKAEMRYWYDLFKFIQPSIVRINRAILAATTALTLYHALFVIAAKCGFESKGQSN